MSGGGAGFAGTIGGKFFGTAPGFVDTEKSPGHSPQPPLPWAKLVRNMVTGRTLIMSPTFLWFSIALTIYFNFPYDYERARTLARKQAESASASRTHREADRHEDDDGDALRQELRGLEDGGEDEEVRFPLVSLGAGVSTP